MEEETINKPKFNFKNFFLNHKIKFISLIILLILSIIVIIVIDEYKKNKNKEISQKFNKARVLIENKKSKDALIILENIVFDQNSFYSPSALNLIIDNNLIKDKTKVLSYFDQVITKSNLDQETKNLFIFKKIIYIGDDIKENDLLNNLNPIIQSDSLWKNTIFDYIKKYYLSKGEFNKAKEFEISINK